LGGPAIAVVKLDGPITDQTVAPHRSGRDRQNVFAQLQRAERDSSVSAVVLRINSPGGSATASQALYNQIRRIHDKGKPVVVHFADIAASGGLYVGVAADRIVSQPATLTGSIGVIIVAADLRGLYDKIGVHQRVFKSGPYKDILSAERDVTPEEQAIMDKLIQDVYGQFVRAVAEGRHLPEADVRQIADGRIISGEEALRLKLVDELGDQYRAVRLAAELAGMRGEPRIVLYEPERPSGLAALLGGQLPGAERLESLLPEPGIGVRYEWKG
jgi:protease-4